MPNCHAKNGHTDVLVLILELLRFYKVRMDGRTDHYYRKKMLLKIVYLLFQYKYVVILF